MIPEVHVSRDRKPRQKARAPAKARGGVLVGIFIGLLLGAILAAASAWYFTRQSPFQPPPGSTPRAPASGDQAPLALPGKPGDRPVVKQDFEFYKILPQGNGAPTEPAPAPVPAAPPPPAERLYLQIGAFEDPGEADNLKARLALSGIEASAQRAKIADGRIVHRVRIGPFVKPEDMNPVRARLAEAGFTATVVKANP